MARQPRLPVRASQFPRLHGYGKGFLNAGDREWGAKMHDDLLDAMDHLVAQGIVDRERMAIYGVSYGGYAALMGATFTPDVFQVCDFDGWPVEPEYPLSSRFPNTGSP